MRKAPEIPGRLRAGDGLYGDGLGSRVMREVPEHSARPNSSARDELEARVRQKEAVAGLGMSALSGGELASLMDEACAVVAKTLSIEYCKVLELLPEGDKLLLRAGVGWQEGYVGRATVGTNLQSQAGYTLISDGPIVVENLKEEIRFKGAPLLHDHGVVSGVTVAIRIENRFFGVLGAHTRRHRLFAAHEVLFLQDVADVLGAAIERRLEEEDSRKTIAEQSDRAEAAERRFEFLAGANALLSASSLDYGMTLENAARLAVPTIADWCFVDVLEPGGELRRAVVSSANSGREELAGGLKRQYPLDPKLPHGPPWVLKTGKPALIPKVDDEVLSSIACDAEHLSILRRLGPNSYMCVPLRVRQRVTGAIGFVSAESGRHYSKEDLALAEGLAHCAALAIDNALNHLPEAALARELVRLAGQDKTVVSSKGEEAPDLTRRQQEVLSLMAEGKPAREISRKLHLSEATVRNHVRSIKQALGARSQLEAIAQARKLGVLPR